MSNTEIWIAIITLAISLVTFLWKVASIYGDLKYQIKQNREDINRMGNALRKEINDKNWITFSLIEDIQEHLNRECNYHPPSLHREDD